MQLSAVSESERAVDDDVKESHGVLPDTVSELTSLPGEDGIEHGPRHCTSLEVAATVQERVQQAQAWVVVARWDGTQIRSEKGRLHNERGKKSGPGRGRGKVARPGWGFLNDGLGWVGRPSSGLLGSFSFSLIVTDRQTGRLPDRHGQAWTGPVRVCWDGRRPRPYHYCTQTIPAAILNMCTPADTAAKVRQVGPSAFRHWRSLLLPSRTGGRG